MSFSKIEKKTNYLQFKEKTTKKTKYITLYFYMKGKYLLNFSIFDNCFSF